MQNLIKVVNKISTLATTTDRDGETETNDLHI